MVFNRSGTAVGGRGENLPVFETEASGEVLQLGRFSKAQHPVTQITVRTSTASPTYNARTRMGCELHAGTAAARLALKREVNAVAATSSAAVATNYPGLVPGFTFDVPAEENDGRLECFAFAMSPEYRTPPSATIGRRTRARSTARPSAVGSAPSA